MPCHAKRPAVIVFQQLVGLSTAIVLPTGPQTWASQIGVLRALTVRRRSC
jgi:hypothetical protein